MSQVGLTMAEDCYSGGDVAGITIGVLIGTVALIAIAAAVYLLLRRKKKVKNNGKTFDYFVCVLCGAFITDVCIVVTAVFF